MIVTSPICNMPNNMIPLIVTILALIVSRALWVSLALLVRLVRDRRVRSYMLLHLTKHLTCHPGP